MTNNKTPKTLDKFFCEKCAFVCSNKKDYNRHLSTDKHQQRTIRTKKTPDHNRLYMCRCGREYKHASSLWNHKKQCCESVSYEKEEQDYSQKDELIERLVNSNNEMREENREIKSMFMLMLEKYQESQLQHQEINRQNQQTTKEIVKGNQELLNKVIEVMPRIGNTTNIEKQTLNFYLTNTCKNAESIHEFTDRFVERSVEFFKENYRQIAWNQVNLASNVFDIFYKCLAENPQYMNFVQTTDVKNGVLYVKEKKKDSNRQLSGEAEFIKYMDGFEKAGLNIGHAINQAFNPLQTKFEEIMKIEFGQKPVEENYEDEDEYENALNDYKEKTGDIKRQLLMQVFNTIGLFENKGKRLEILSKTKRAIADGAAIE